MLMALGLLLFAAWGGWFIWSSSFLVGSERYFCLFDDSMISMTYARNLAEGHGLGWARWGAPVEGYTNPLWTFSMLLVQWPGLPLSLRPLLVQLASLALLVANVVVVHRLARRHVCTHVPAFAGAAAFASAAYFPLAYWSLMGMETALQALLTSLAVLFAFDTAHGGPPRALALWGVFTAAVLLRIDMLLPVAVVTGYLALRGSLRRTGPRPWLLGAACFALALGGYQLFRLAWFGDPLPNTWYLKMTGDDPVVRVLRGLAVAGDVARCTWITLLAAGVGTLLTASSRPRHLLLAALVACAFGYSIWVGGDVWEASAMTGNRFVAYAVPLLCVLVAGIADRAAERWRPHPGPALAWPAAVGLALLLGLDLNGLVSGPHKDVRWGYLRIDGAPFHVDLHARVTADSLRLRDQLPAHTRVAVVWSGIPSFFTDFRMVDTLGYNDRHVARGAWAQAVPRSQARWFVPGHMKHDLAFTLRVREPEVLFQWWPGWGDEERELLREAGFVRQRTGPHVEASAGEVWLKPPLALDLEQWRRTRQVRH